MIAWLSLTLAFAQEMPSPKSEPGSEEEKHEQSPEKDSSKEINEDIKSNKNDTLTEPDSAPLGTDQATQDKAESSSADTPKNTSEPLQSTTENSSDDRKNITENPIDEPSKERLPILKSDSPASYPELALREGRGGAVLLELTVTVDGTVIDAVVVEEAGYGFDQAALDAISRYRFEPALDANGTPANARIRFRYTFKPEMVPLLCWRPPFLKLASAKH